MLLEKDRSDDGSILYSPVGSIIKGMDICRGEDVADGPDDIPLSGRVMVEPEGDAQSGRVKVELDGDAQADDVPSSGRILVEPNGDAQADDVLSSGRYISSGSVRTTSVATHAT